MIKSFFSMLLGVALTAPAFSNGDPVTNGFAKVNTTESTITWVGKKVTGQHTGNVSIDQGQFQFEDGKLVGGNFTIDMTTIQVTDLQGGGKDKLEGHLKSDDFFGVSTFPKATLIVTDVKSTGKNTYDVKANLTIKGITQPVSFPATVNWSDNQYVATAKITIDRSLYNVRYGSGKFFENLGDNTIYDDFTLDVNVVAKS